MQVSFNELYGRLFFQASTQPKRKYTKRLKKMKTIKRVDETRETHNDDSVPPHFLPIPD